MFWSIYVLGASQLCEQSYFYLPTIDTIVNKEQIQPLESVKVHENKMSFPFILVPGEFFFPTFEGKTPWFKLIWPFVFIR